MRNKPLVFAFVIVPLFCCLVVACLTAGSSFTWKYQGEEFDIGRDGSPVSRKFKEERKKLASGPSPRAVTDESVFDFGVMDPLTMGKHSFVIRNEGDAPLLLKKGPTTCKCTLSDLSQDTLEPGETATVTLEWNTGRKYQVYAHEATIFSNDLRRKQIVLRVEGIVRFYAATAPQEPTFGDIRPDQPANSEVVVYSQIWDSFELRDAKSSLEELTWESEPLDERTLAALEATAGFRLKLHLPAGMPQGEVSGMLHLSVAAAKRDEQDVVEHDVLIAGRVMRPLAVYGPGIDEFGLLELGRIRSREGLQRLLVVKVRDDQRQLNVTNVVTHPEFLKVELSEMGEGDAPAGVYRLEVSIPPGTPPGLYNRLNEAGIHLEFDHPRIRELKLRSRFTIVE